MTRVGDRGVERARLARVGLPDHPYARQLEAFDDSAAHVAIDRLIASLSLESFLGGAAAVGATLAADMTALNALAAPAVSKELKEKQKRVILLWLAGGASQLETWDPKPGATTGGPFRSIQTDVPGLRISELMPKMATRMKTTCVIRGLNTKNGDHGSAAKTMMRGRRDESKQIWQLMSLEQWYRNARAAGVAAP